MAIIMFIIGAIFGSFFLVIATRMPKGEDVITSRSRCDICKKTLKWYHLIPIISYIIQKGRCTYCHNQISKDHLIIEISTGLLFMVSSLIFPIGYKFFMSLIVISLMLIIFISDFKYMVILDSTLIISSILMILLKLIYLGLNETLNSLISGLIMFTIMLLIEKLGTLILKKDCLGGGDIKLGFVMGLCVNLKLAITSLVLSTFLALPYATASLYLKKDHEFPYGPFLSGALFIVFFNADKFNLLLKYLFYL